MSRVKRAPASPQARAQDGIATEPSSAGVAAAPETPTVAFVVATLNEEHRIEDCVRSLLDQRYPADQLEVAVIDGGSTDRTREIVSKLADADPRIKLLPNPGRIAASAFNIGVQATGGDVISLVCAHSTLDPDYAGRLVQAFQASEAALIGGREEAEADPADGPMAEAIVRALSSPLGVGSALYHYSEQPGWVDTAFPGAYRRALFTEIGGFDESLVRNQDDEFHLRARIAGHRMWFDPRIRSSYRPRPTLRALWRQQFEYGWWRSVTMRKHRRVASIRHLAPAALVAGLAGGPVLAAVTSRGLVLLAWVGGVAAWSAVLATAGWRERDAPPAVAARVPAAVGCLHLAYGTGFWAGLGNQLVAILGSVRRR